MESAFLHSSLSPLHFHPLSSILNQDSTRKALKTRVFAARRSEEANDRNYSGRLVDMNMIVLRKRIHEMKMVERNYEPPSDWLEWEKHYFTRYDSLICEMVGLVQSQLMNTRPFFALAFLALIAFSVPMASAMVFSHFFNMLAKLEEVNGIHFY